MSAAPGVYELDRIMVLQEMARTGTFEEFMEMYYSSDWLPTMSEEEQIVIQLLGRYLEDAAVISTVGMYLSRLYEAMRGSDGCL